MSLKHTINLGNSIIGVSILAMPFCFSKCGIILGTVSILLSGILNRAGCHLILKSAMMSKRRNFELLAYQCFGSTGKLVAEFGVLGFLLGSCVAFFVVIGDLAPSLVSELFSIPNGPHLRAFLLTFLGMFVALPLGLLRRVDSLTSFSALSLGLYLFLILKMFSETSDHLITTPTKVFKEQIILWELSGLWTTLPIFAMALACQPQLFEIFDSSAIMSEDYSSIKRMNAVIKDAVNLSSLVYISVGVFGYLAFFDQPFRGNILVFLPASFTSTLAKTGFIFTVIISLPLCLFPCRTSLHSMLFRKGTGSLLNEMPHSQTLYMSDRHFTILTIILIVFTIGVSVLLPHIEVILGIIGSTIGTVICFILPAAIYLSLTKHNTTERLMANMVLYVGIFMLVVCSYSTIQDAKTANDIETPLDTLKAMKSKSEEIAKLPSIKSSVSSLHSKPKMSSPELPKVLPDHGLREKDKEKALDLGKELLKKLNKDREEQLKLMKENAALQKQILKEIQHLDADHHKTGGIHSKAEAVHLKQQDTHNASVQKSPLNELKSSLKQPLEKNDLKLSKVDPVKLKDIPVKPVENMKAKKLISPIKQEVPHTSNNATRPESKVAEKMKGDSSGQVVKANKSVHKETNENRNKLPKRDTLSVET